VIARFGATPVPKLDLHVDAVIIAVAHQQFRAMKASEILGLMGRNPVLGDVRGMMDPEVAGRNGLYYRKL